jgi:hypothetical protein
MSVYSITNGDLTYYGSTTQTLSQRKSEHKYSYKNHKTWYRSALVFENAEKTDTKVIISLVEQVNGTDAELLEREKWYIENNSCVNRKALTLEEKNKRRRDKYLANKIKSLDSV